MESSWSILLPGNFSLLEERKKKPGDGDGLQGKEVERQRGE